ncbi:MAG: hypothetical protein V1792_13050 [Pseudomonadota bacterium]
MEGKEIMLHQQGALMDTPAAPEGCTGGSTNPGTDLMGAGEEACAQRETEEPDCGCTAASPRQSPPTGPVTTNRQEGVDRVQPDRPETCTNGEDSPHGCGEQPVFQSPPEMFQGYNPGVGPRQTGAVPGLGYPVGGGDYGGFQASPHMTDAWNTGAGFPQMAPVAGAGPHPAHTVHQPGSYGPPVYGHPTGGPPPWGHPVSGHHQHCLHQQPPAYGYPPHIPFSPTAGSEEGRHHGQFSEVVGKALQGRATPQDLISGLLNLDFRDDQFWKGVVVGTTAAILFNSNSVRQALAGALGGVFGTSKENAQSED